MKNFDIKKLILLIASVYIILGHLHWATKTYYNTYIKIKADIKEEQSFCDFKYYYQISKILREKINAYELIRGGVYSPLFFLTIIPFTLLPYSYAILMWLLVNYIFIALCLIYTAKLVKNKNDNFHFPILSILLFASEPLRDNIAFGNINIIILFGLILIAYFYSNNRKILAGIFLSVVISLKVYYGLLFFFFLWKRENKVILSSIISYIFIRLFGILLLGLDVEISYWKNISFWTSVYYIDHRGIGILNILSLLLMDRKIIILTYFVIFLFFFIFTLRNISRFENTNFLKEFSSIICFIIFITPLSAMQNLIVSFLPFSVLIYEIRLTYRNILLLLTSFLLTNLPYSLYSFPIFQSGILSIFLGTRIYGQIILWYLIQKVILDEKFSNYNLKR